MKNHQDAEEVTQDVLLRVFRKIGAFRGDASLSSWIYRITFNTAMSRLRRHRAGRRLEQERDRVEVARGPLRRPGEAADWSHMADETLLRAQLRDAVAKAIAELPEIYRAPVMLRDIQGLSTEEASTRLHVKDQTLKSRLHRGRLMLRDRLRMFASGLTLHRREPAYG
jgi:RNA polymerase sigma-70 factor (ECF subfamily)